MYIMDQATILKEIIIRKVRHECGYEFETSKTENIQCFGCKKRFDLKLGD